jgi:hypothetical protein
MINLSASEFAALLSPEVELSLFKQIAGLSADSPDRLPLLEKYNNSRKARRALEAHQESQELESVVEEPSGAPPVSQEDDYQNPVVILALDAITHQATALATIDASSLEWLKTSLALIRKVPTGASTRRQEPSGAPPVFDRKSYSRNRVRVLRIDRNEYSGPWQVGKIFENCADATRQLGCKQNYNVVLKNFKKGEDGLDESTVAGVTFCYADAYQAQVDAEVEANYRD